MALLRAGDELTNTDRSGRYLIGEQIGEGAFAEAYEAERLDRRDRPIGKVCVKVLDDITSWHGESYFGALLSDQPRVVSLLDSFPYQRGDGMSTRMRFVLVFELENDTVEQYFERGGSPWSHAGARREYLGLLQVLDLLHGMGASHRDIKPDNVFVGDRRRVKLGDFGIAKHGPGGRPTRLSRSTLRYTPASLRNLQRQQWLFSDDLYQVSLLCVTLLTGKVATDVSRSDIASLGLDEPFERVLRNSLGPRSARFENAAQAIASFNQSGSDVAPPASLKGRRVVFTGPLPVARSEARTALAQVGGEFREDVNGQTDVLVVGTPSLRYSRPKRGTKLAEAHKRIKAGQPIAILSWSDFTRLTK